MKVVRNVPHYRPAQTQKKQGQQTKTILYQGAVNTGRGLEWVIDAMPYVKDAQLLIIGSAANNIFVGGYDNDLKAWFDYELFDMDDSTSWLNEWLAAKSVTATFTGKDGSTKTYTLTKDNLQAIRDILNAYDTLLGSDVSTARVVLRGLVK